MKTEDLSAYDWPALVTRLGPHFGTRHPHAIAAVVVRNNQVNPRRVDDLTPQP
jgi:hypothetical protein